MKAFQALALAAVGISVDAHYIFNILIVNDQAVGGEYEYFCRNTNSYNPAFTDILATENLR